MCRSGKQAARKRLVRCYYYYYYINDRPSSQAPFPCTQIITRPRRQSLDRDTSNSICLYYKSIAAVCSTNIALKNCVLVCLYYIVGVFELATIVTTMHTLPHRSEHHCCSKYYFRVLEIYILGLICISWRTVGEKGIIFVRNIMEECVLACGQILVFATTNNYCIWKRYSYIYIYIGIAIIIFW